LRQVAHGVDERDGNGADFGFHVSEC
jgi:hypothetical protein